MIYSNACSYAIRAMTILAAIQPDGFVLLKDLRKHDKELPRHFLAKICQDLTRKKLLVSAKGRGGGFALARTPDKISLFDIVSAIDSVSLINDCVLGLKNCDDAQPCPLHDAWKIHRSQLELFLKGTTLQSMAQALSKKLP